MSVKVNLSTKIMLPLDYWVGDKGLQEILKAPTYLKDSGDVRHEALDERWALPRHYGIRKRIICYIVSTVMRRRAVAARGEQVVY